MSWFRTGDPRHPGGPSANPYENLLAVGPPAGRPDGGAPAREQAAGRPSAPTVTVVLPGELSPRQAARPAMAERVQAPGPAVAERARDARRSARRSARRPSARPGRFRRYYGRGLTFLLGLGIGGSFLTGVALDRLGEWDHAVPLETDTRLAFPPAQERWIWLPEERTGDLVCAATDGAGANLPMRPALGYDHDDYSSAFRFPTGDGDVTLRCGPAPAPATPGWTPTGVEQVRVAEPVDRAEDLPFLQAALVLTVGGAGLGLLVLVGTALTQLVTAVARTLSRRR